MSSSQSSVSSSDWVGEASKSASRVLKESATGDCSLKNISLLALICAILWIAFSMGIILKQKIKDCTDDDEEIGSYSLGTIILMGIAASILTLWIPYKGMHCLI